MAGVRLSGAVMAHPRRIGRATALAGAAGPEPLAVVLDPEPDGPSTGLRTAIRAWSSVPAGSTHHLVLEDDARPCRGFFEHAARASAAAPDAAIAFYANWCARSGAAVRLGALAGARLVRPPAEYTPTVALLLPASLGAGFADYAHGCPDRWPDDVLMDRYLRAACVTTYVTVPNLVQHGELPSVSDNDHHGLRLSACYADPPPGADWSVADASYPDIVPFFKNGLALCSVRRPDGGWRTLSGEHGLRMQGADPVRVGARLWDALAVSPGAGLLRHSLSDEVLTAFWQTAYSTGRLGREPGRQPDLAAELAAWSADPLVNAALETLGPGGLCTTHSPAQLAWMRRPLRELARSGLAAGAADRGHEPATRVSGSRAPRVVITPADHPLAAALADDLACRGHHVSVATAAEAGAAGRDEAEAGRKAEVGREAGVGWETGPGLEAEADQEVEVGREAESGPEAEAAEVDQAGDVVVVHIGGHADVHGGGGDGAGDLRGPGAALKAAPARSGVARTGPARKVVHLCGAACAAGSAAPGAITGVTVLRTGTPYGPGVADDASVRDLVVRALRRRPITVDADGSEPPHLVHLWDLATAIERLLEAGAPGGVYDIREETAVSVPELARAVARAVVPVPVVVNGPAAGSAAAPPPSRRAAESLAPLGWRRAYPLADGLTTVAQWLAYDEERTWN